MRRIHESNSHAHTFNAISMTLIIKILWISNEENNIALWLCACKCHEPIPCTLYCESESNSCSLEQLVSLAHEIHLKTLSRNIVNYFDNDKAIIARQTHAMPFRVWHRSSSRQLFNWMCSPLAYNSCAGKTIPFFAVFASRMKSFWPSTTTPRQTTDDETNWIVHHFAENCAREKGKPNRKTRSTPSPARVEHRNGRNANCEYWTIKFYRVYTRSYSHAAGVCEEIKLFYVKKADVYVSHRRSRQRPAEEMCLFVVLLRCHGRYIAPNHEWENSSRFLFTFFMRKRWIFIFSLTRSLPLTQSWINIYICLCWACNRHRIPPSNSPSTRMIMMHWKSLWSEA